MTDIADFMKMKEPGLRIDGIPSPFEADIVPYGRSAADLGFPMADIVVRNLWNRPEDVVVEVTVGSCKRSTIQEMEPHGNAELTLRASDFQFPDRALRCGTSQNVCVNVKDGIGRTVTSKSYRLRFAEDSTRPVIAAEIRSTRPEWTGGNCRIGYVEFESDTDDQEVCTVRISSDGVCLQSQDVRIAPDCLSSHPLDLEGSLVENAGSAEFRVDVILAGCHIARGTIDTSLATNGAGCRGTTEARSIFARCTFFNMVDVHDSPSSNVNLGKVSVTNRSQSETRVRVIMDMNGENVENDVVVIGPHQTIDSYLRIPITKALCRESRLVDLRCFVLDHNEMPIFSRSGATEIRSQFDMNLSLRNQRVAKFVNPGAPGIKDLVISSGSPLSRAMGDAYAITGYMQSEKIVPQLSGLYKAMTSLGLDYVHDTLMADGYQRVRSPTSVLEDGNGDCMELSLLLASVMERIGFEPVVVFVPGHAMVGIVTSTDMYRSESKVPDSLRDLIVHVDTAGGHYFDALLLESTYLAYANTNLVQSCRKARDTATENLGHVAKGNFVLIGKERESGVRPTLASVGRSEA